MVAEPGLDAVWGNVDNYLHEAALAASPPSGTVYDPEGDGIPLASLGVHEHWNNPEDRLYSGNLGLPGGIELFIPGRMTAVTETDLATPDAFAISSYPNPFNATATLSWSQPSEAPVHLSVYDAVGQLVAEIDQGIVAAGTHAIPWNAIDDAGRRLASGTYFARLTAGAQLRVTRLTLLR